jgi:hypothetical protein
MENDQLTPENKLEVLKRLQSKSFLEPEEKDQLEKLQAEQDSFEDAYKKKLNPLARSGNQLKGLFPSQ